ncbi:MAG: hypothetical protein SPI72_03305 [Porphyromonas sp.]|nr:hypothetical protein [Porphyromonas sp.]
MERLLDLLMALLPSGGLGIFLGWLVSAKLRKARTDEEISNIYKNLYDSIKETVTAQSDEITTLQETMLDLQHRHMRLMQIVNQARICRYWSDHCPIRRQLQDEAGEPLYAPKYHEGRAAPRQHEPQDDASDEPPKPTRGEGTDSYTDIEPP